MESVANMKHKCEFGICKNPATVFYVRKNENNSLQNLTRCLRHRLEFLIDVMDEISEAEYTIWEVMNS